MRNVHGEKCVIKKKDEDICSGLLVSEITPSEIEIAVEELERCKSPGVDQNSAHWSKQDVTYNIMWYSNSIKKKNPLEPVITPVYKQGNNNV